VKDICPTIFVVAADAQLKGRPVLLNYKLF
jgi:hypothetical protein